MGFLRKCKALAAKCKAALSSSDAAADTPVYLSAAAQEAHRKEAKRLGAKEGRACDLSKTADAASWENAVLKGLKNSAEQRAAKAWLDASNKHKRLWWRGALATGLAVLANALVPCLGLMVMVPFVIWDTYSYLFDLGLVPKITWEGLKKCFKGREPADQSREPLLQAAHVVQSDLLVGAATPFLRDMLSDVLGAALVQAVCQAASAIPFLAFAVWPFSFGAHQWRQHEFRKAMNTKAVVRHLKWLEQHKAELLGLAQQARETDANTRASSIDSAPKPPSSSTYHFTASTSVPTPTTPANPPRTARHRAEYAS